MPTSRFNSIMQSTGIPVLLRTFGIAATHTNADGDEVAVTVILRQQTVAVGEYGERAELQWTLQLPSASNARVGQTFSIENDATDDDPYPDPTVWITTQLIDDDGLLRRFAVRSSS